MMTYYGWYEGTCQLTYRYTRSRMWTLFDTNGKVSAEIIEDALDYYAVQTFGEGERLGERVWIPCTLQQAKDHALQVLGEKSTLDGG